MCRVDKERFVFLYLLYGFANYAFPTPQCYSHSSWRVRWQTLLNRLSSHAAAAGRLPVCLWLLSWWHCRLPGKVEGHSCLFSFKFSVSPCYSRIFLGVENPQSIQWPTGLLCCTDCTPPEESWAQHPAVAGPEQEALPSCPITPGIGLRNRAGNTLLMQVLGLRFLSVSIYLCLMVNT